MIDFPDEATGIEDTLAEGIAAVIAANETPDQPADLADLFLEELNRLWSEPEPLILG